jgi:hypothetical protein
MIALAAEHRFAQWVAVGTILRCWAVGGAVTSQPRHCEYAASCWGIPRERDGMGGIVLPRAYR